MPRIDYDKIAHIYDEPSRDHDVDSYLLTFLNERNLDAADVRVVDIGCGTGKQLAANHEHWPTTHFVGIDRSAAMLRIARTRCPSVSWIRGDGAALPLASDIADYVTSQFSYPHIAQTREMVLEVFRLLSAGGRFVMTNIDPWSMRGWLVYRYFPEALEVDFRDFVPADRFLAFMRDAGFEQIGISRTDLSRDARLDEFLEYASSRHRASQFTAICDAAFDRGIRRLQTAVAKAPNVVERSEFVHVTIIGDKPFVASAA